MCRMIGKACIGVILATLASSWCFAGNVTVQGDGTATWQAGVDGVEIEWNPDGSVRRISSKFATPVEFGDRRGISMAQVIAEEKAKAAIIRFMNQSVMSNRVVTEVQTDLNKATQERNTGSLAQIKKIDERTLVENLTEVTGSFASGNLQGVLILEKGYDDKTDEAWVVVGISDKTIRASRTVKNMFPDVENPKTSNEKTGSDVGIQPSEVRRTNQKDW